MYSPILTIMMLSLMDFASKPVSADVISETNQQISLPEYIYMGPCDGPTLDQDNDSLKDDYENRLADTWRPYFEFDEEESARQSFEPLTLFQVRPIGDKSWPRRIKIAWAFLYQRDGGYGEDWKCALGRNDHPGDAAGGYYILTSDDGITWKLDKIQLWDERNELDARNGEIKWTNPRSTYWGQMLDRPSPKIFPSAGKHHQYISTSACEDSDGFCSEDCGQGAKIYADLTSVVNGKFNNVGERQLSPWDTFVNNLNKYYANEYVWYPVNTCKGKPTFTGGLTKCSTEVSAIYEVLDSSPIPEEYKYDVLSYNPSSCKGGTFTCGPQFATYSVRSEGGSGWPVAGVRCVLFRDSEVVNGAIAGANWYGEGRWGNFSYRHAGRTDKRPADLAGKNFTTASEAADIYGNGENGSGRTYNLKLIPVNGWEKIRVVGDWGEQWTYEPSGVAAFTSDLGPITNCGHNYDQLTVTDSNGSTAYGSGVRCLRRARDDYRFPSLWVGEGQWHGGRYMNFGYITPGDYTSFMYGTAADICAKSNYACGWTATNGLKINAKMSCYQKLNYAVTGNWNELWLGTNNFYNCPR